MKRILLSAILIILLVILAIKWLPMNKKNESSDQPTGISQASIYITPEGQVTDAIVNLLGLTGIRIDGDTLLSEKDWPEAKLWIKSRNLTEVVPAIQGKLNPKINWLGDAKKERWEEDSSKPKLMLPLAIKIINICSVTLKQSEQVLPIREPQAVLFLGATLSRVRTRLAYLNHLYDTQQTSVDLPVYVLTGERKLDEKAGETQVALMDSKNRIVPFHKDWKKSDDLVTDEGHMIQLVFAQSRHPSLKMDKVFFVYSPRGEGRRATTESTVLQWLKDHNLASGYYIAISNQPYNFYQESVIRRVLLQAGRSDIQVQVIGPAMSSEIGDENAVIDRAKNLLNNLSRILYGLNQIHKFKMN